jgi:hypothetical protein
MINRILLQLESRRHALVGLAIVLMLSLWGCNQAAPLRPKTRPVGIPSDAVWVGGADGGAYVRCTIDSARNVNPCSVWNDYTGDLIESGDYRLRTEDRAATDAELNISFPDFGGLIYLQKGLVLKRLR